MTFVRSMAILDIKIFFLNNSIFYCMIIVAYYLLEFHAELSCF